MMNFNRRSLGDLREQLNSRAKTLSTIKNKDVNEEVVITIQNNTRRRNKNETTRKRPADISTDLKETKKVITSTPILQCNPIFNLRVSEYTEHSKNITNSIQYLAGSVCSGYVNQTVIKSQVNDFNSIGYENQSIPAINHLQNLYNPNNTLRTVHVDKNIKVTIINNTNTSNIMQSTKNSMEVNTIDKKQDAVAINSDIILLPNTKPTSQMQERINEALDSILHLTSNNIASQPNMRETDVKLFNRAFLKLIHYRIMSVLTGHPVRSRSDIIERYLKRYPKEKEFELLRLYNTRHGLRSVPYLIETDNPEHFFRVNMMRLINIKMKKIISVVESMFSNSRQQLLLLKKAIKTKRRDPKYTVRHCSETYLNLLLEQEFSRLLAKFKVEIVHRISHKETAAAIKMNVIQIQK